MKLTLAFVWSRFPTWTKKLGQKLIYLKNENSFKREIKILFHHFKASLLKHILTILEGEDLALKNSWKDLKFDRYKCSKQENVLRTKTCRELRLLVTRWLYITFPMEFFFYGPILHFFFGFNFGIFHCAAKQIERRYFLTAVDSCSFIDNEQWQHIRPSNRRLVLSIYNNHRIIVL